MNILRIPPPIHGLVEGLDPSLPDEIYQPTYSPDLENVRVSGGTWETRLGMSSAVAAAGSGAGRFLDTLYLDNGSRYRLMARGNSTAAILYKLLVGTDSAWQAVTGGTGLGNSTGETFQGVALGGRFYLTDRQGVLRSYVSTTNTLESVGQPSTPSTEPRVIPRTYALLDGFAGSDPYGWNESDSANFSLDAYSSIQLPAAGSYGSGTVRQLLVDNTGALGDTISKDRPSYPVPSSAMAFYVEQPTTRSPFVIFEYGITAPAQFSVQIDPGEVDVTKIIFVPLGAIGSLSYARFRVTRDPSATRPVVLGPLMLPGNLQGQYRWGYTHYDPASGEESGLSPLSNGGEFSNFSRVGVSYDNTTVEGEGSALYKSAALVPTTDSGTDSATTQVRWYRNGGVPELTSNGGQPVWTRVGATIDLDTQLDGAVSAGDRRLILDAVGNSGGNYADGDGLIFEDGTDGKEEVGRIAHYRLFDITVVDGTARTVSSASYNFIASDVGGELVLLGKNAASTAIVAKSYTIDSVAGGIATLVLADGSPGATGASAYGYLEAVNASTKRVFLADGLLNAHADNAIVKACFLDNTADAAVDAENVLDRERDNPPTGVRCLDRAADARLLLFGWPDRPMGVAYSNRPTVDRPRDFEVFPDGVDPFTRRSETQGFRIDLSGDASGDAIVWGGLFQQNPTALSRRALWQIYAGGQSDFGPTSVVRREEVGCIAGDTVKRIDDALYWVAPGPRVMRWSGQGDPQDLSFQRVNVTLAAAPTAYHYKWWAQVHTDQRGTYYRLWIVPSGGTTPTMRLDYNVTADLWERTVYYDSGGTALPFACGTVLDVAADVGEQWALQATSGVTYQQETGLTDAGEVIRVTAKTKKFDLGHVARIENFWLRLTGATDNLSVSVLTGGSQYGNVANSYSSLSTAGSGDVELKKRVAFNQKGRWVQFSLTGSLSSRPALREFAAWFSGIRSGKVQ